MPDLDAPVENVEETSRRRIRSLASLIELARQVQAGERATRLNRQMLMASMGAIDAGAGAVFRIERDGRVRLLEAIGVRRGTPRGLTLSLEERAAATLRAPAPLEILSGAGVDPWRSLVRPIDPAFQPEVLFRLGGPKGLVGFVLLGNLASMAPKHREDSGIYKALAGLVGL